MRRVAVLDEQALTRALRRLAGGRFLGVVDSCDAIELVFEDVGGAPRERNLLTIFVTGPRAGTVAFGGVDGPKGYVDAYGAHPVREGAAR